MMNSACGSRISLRGGLVILFLIVALAVTGLWTNYGQEVKALLGAGPRLKTIQAHIATDNKGHYLALPEILVKNGIYPNDSFANEAGIIPSYWEGLAANETLDDKRRATTGPCYSYVKRKVDWEKEIAYCNATGQPRYNEIKRNSPPRDLEGYCRPGFLIIGQGKCGTSSLYHYVTQHPKVLPATEKQIHYFKYNKHLGKKWYYQHFPSTASFLAAGALMAGEASPGYLPYPDVVADVRKFLPEPRILVIGRNPLERAYSSYNYNYVVPHVEYLQKHSRSGLHKDIPKGKPTDFYRQYLFSFEDMMRAELAVLRECFAPGSSAVNETRRKWGWLGWMKEEVDRREKEGLPPLIDLDGFCYGFKVNATVPRKQWAGLIAEQPDKYILHRNLHLTQAMIGRSLYLFPLEWWYAAFSSDHIYFVCTEELEDMTGESMNSVGQFLGLPRYENFSAVVQGGAYNVGGHRGYDNEISWSQLNNEHKSDEVPLSEELRHEVEEFIRPYNERLFALTGRRCNW